jgi:putative transcriptional regulator
MANGEGMTPMIAKSDIPASIMPSKYSGSGCVLLSQPNEKDQFLMQSAIFIFCDSDKLGTQGVLFDKPSAFSMGQSLKVSGPFDGNPLFMGGIGGSDTAIMLHKHGLNNARYLGYGLYLGGMPHATELIDRLAASPREFKFIFNYVYWRPGVLQSEIAAGRWDTCVLPPDLILSQRYEGVWSKARQALHHCNTLIDMG